MFAFDLRMARREIFFEPTEFVSKILPTAEDVAVKVNG